MIYCEIIESFIEIFLRDEVFTSADERTDFCKRAYQFAFSRPIFAGAAQSSYLNKLILFGSVLYFLQFILSISERIGKLLHTGFVSADRCDILNRIDFTGKIIIGVIVNIIPGFFDFVAEFLKLFADVFHGGLIRLGSNTERIGDQLADFLS